MLDVRYEKRMLKESSCKFAKSLNVKDFKSLIFGCLNIFFYIFSIFFEVIEN